MQSDSNAPNPIPPQVPQTPLYTTPATPTQSASVPEPTTQFSLKLLGLTTIIGFVFGLITVLIYWSVDKAIGPCNESITGSVACQILTTTGIFSLGLIPLIIDIIPTLIFNGILPALILRNLRVPRYLWVIGVADLWAFCIYILTIRSKAALPLLVVVYAIASGLSYLMFNRIAPKGKVAPIVSIGLMLLVLIIVSTIHGKQTTQQLHGSMLSGLSHYSFQLYRPTNLIYGQPMLTGIDPEDSFVSLNYNTWTSRTRDYSHGGQLNICIASSSDISTSLPSSNGCAPQVATGNGQTDFPCTPIGTLSGGETICEYSGSYSVEGDITQGRIIYTETGTSQIVTRLDNPSTWSNTDIVTVFNSLKQTTPAELVKLNTY